ncbi:RDD family protein [Kribbella catacumbae]|uniref:RDD family protein n=1 Tax=Kribbella catacumbae TaxID=460086 RepID=UPI00037C826B|nr:RDD family protein [Kribbella catacumbae]
MSTPPSGPQYPGQPGQYPPGQPGDHSNSQYAPGPPVYTPGGSHLQGGYGYAPPGQLAGWPVRVGASVIDSLVQLPPAVIGVIVAVAVNGDSRQLTPAAATSMVLGGLLSLLVAIWNRVIKQGRSGQSIGKQVTGLKIVSARTGQTIGVGRTLGREICANIFNNLCFLNLLWPLWDAKQQTWHDKVVSDLVIKL